MSCRDWEERIALHAGGEQTGEQAAEVERHLAECAGCRETAASYGWGLELLREAHREPIAPAHYAAVRARVLAELGRERRPVWWPVWGWGLAAAVAVVAVMMFPRPVGRASRPAFLPSAPVAQVSRPATPPKSHTAIAKPAAHRRHPTLAQVKQEGRPGGPPHLEAVTIKLLTDDPNVIIYWIADRKGE
jgi:anti-sigma factor RsiW